MKSISNAILASSIAMTALSLVMCSSDSSNQSSSGSSGRGSSSGNTASSSGSTEADSGTPTSEPLTCLSHAWCTSSEITSWRGQVLPKERGGTIVNGLYRLAYAMEEKGSGTGRARGTDRKAYLFRDGGVRILGSFPSVGTFTTSNGKLTVTDTHMCNDRTGETSQGATGKPTPQDYLVDSNGNLILFSTFDAGINVAEVFKKVDALCKGLPTTVPAAPGDSLTCHTRNCGCAEASNGPANAQVCKVVYGN